MEYLGKSPLKFEEKGGYFNQENITSAHLESFDIIAKHQEILDEILEKDLDNETKKLLITRIFEHSTTDGLKLAEKANFTNKEYLDILNNPKFYLKHKNLVDTIISEAEYSVQSEADKDKLELLKNTYKEYDDNLAVGKDKVFLKKEKAKDIPTREMLTKIDDWYAQFLQTKELKPVSGEDDPRSRGEQWGESSIEQIQLALDKNYYPGDLLNVITRQIAESDEASTRRQATELFAHSPSLLDRYKHTGFDKYWADVRRGQASVRDLAFTSLRDKLNKKELEIVEFGEFVPDDIVQKIIKTYGIKDEKLLKEIESARYKPLDITFKMQAREAEKELVKEINVQGKDIVWNVMKGEFELEKSKFEKPEGKFLTEEKILDELEQLIKDGTSKSSVAMGLAGLDSDKAWKMREQLMKDGADEDFVAMGLAGLDSDKAWKMREQLMKDGASKSSVARGLAGCDSDRAWAMREQLIKDGASKSFVAEGLAGLDSDKAWKMREQLIKDGADKSSVAMGLAGLDSDKAWKMREQLMKDGVSKDYVVRSLAGNYITFVWQLKNKPIEEKEEQKITREVAKEFDEYKLKEQIGQYLNQDSLMAQQRNKSLKEKLRQGAKQSKFFAQTVTTVIKEAPGVFRETMAAKKDARLTAKKLANKTFPSTLWNKSEDNWRGWGGYSGFESGSSDFKKDPEPEDYLNPNSMNMMLGGNPEGSGKGGEDKEVMKFREPINNLMVTGIYGRLAGNNWDSSYQFPVDKKIMEKAKEVTITLPKVGTRAKLPKLLATEIIAERVKGIKMGDEVPLTVDISPMREGLVNDTKKCSELVYSIEIDEVPSAMRELSHEAYNTYKEKFVKNNGKEVVDEIANLPEEIDLFLTQIKDKNPKEQVQAIEQFVRTISYYDMKNGEMIDLKRNKSLDERLEIMQARVDELREKNKDNQASLQGKMYAGVCADFAVLTTAILRRAGFASGVLSGFMPDGKSAKVSNAHGTAFVVWPNIRGGNEIFSVDGTPTGIEGVSGPSLVELERTREEKIEEIKKESLEKLDEIMKILESHNEESIKKLTNGELEKVLNTVLRYEVKQKNTQAITRLLEAYWYSPIHKLDLKEMDDKIKFLKFFESEIESGRASKVESVADPGSKLFETVETFAQRFTKGETNQLGLDIIDNISSLVGNKLSDSERKALTVVTTYLRATKIKGDSVSSNK